MTTSSKCRALADGWFSVYIRIRDTDFRGNGKCITCGVKKNWKKADCGHFQSRGHLNTRWFENNAHLQCKLCNGPRGGGEQHRHGKFIESRYGKGYDTELQARARMLFKPGSVGILEIARKFKDRAYTEAEKRGIDLSDYEKRLRL
jgi:hypothetical protein